MALKNYCQSCGASIAEPEAQRGVEKDGSVSEEYCAHCYQNGEFCVESYEETLEQSSQNFHPALKKLEDP
ncbi:MAG: hypothetical protein HUK22_07515, partial [Thermoguttaceae bacterium]|nr:hypothetical protein [Thermoguttaceae bacterium]